MFNFNLSVKIYRSIDVMKGRNIPCIDIISCDPTTHHGFGFYWHTQQDNMNNISNETLNAVGQVIMEIIYTIE